MKKKSFVICIISILLALPAGVSAQKKDKSLQGAPKKGNSCINCHDVLAGRLKKPVTHWRMSVHAKAGNQCNICHGGNPASNNKVLSKSKKYDFIGKPDKRVITDFCGRGGCHIDSLEQFKSGPHYQSVLRTNQPNCTSCHGIHNIKESSIDVITEEKCIACHPPGYSKEIIALIADIDTSLNKINKNISFLLGKHAEISDLRKRFGETKHLYHQLVHVFSRDDMINTKRVIQLQIKNLDVETNSKVALLKRLDMLYLVMVVFGLLIIISIIFYTMIMYSRRRA